MPIDLVMEQRKETRTLSGSPVSVVALSDPATGRRFWIGESGLGSLSLIPDGGRARTFSENVRPGAPILLSVIEPTGRLQAQCEVEGYKEESRSLVVSDPGFFYHVQQRANYRVDLAIGVELMMQRHDRVVLAVGDSLDISNSGMAACLIEQLDEGASVAICLQLPDGPLLAVGNVIGVHPQRTRLEFTQMAAGDRNRLAQYLRRVEIALASAGLG